MEQLVNDDKLDFSINLYLKQSKSKKGVQQRGLLDETATLQLSCSPMRVFNKI